MYLLQSIVIFLGRLFIGIPFIFFAFQIFFCWEQALLLLGQIDVKYASLALVLSSLLVMLAGIAVILGFWTRLAVLILLLFLLPLIAVKSDFWALSETAFEVTRFLQGVAIAGGLLLLLAVGPGELSFDGRRRRQREARKHSEENLEPVRDSEAFIQGEDAEF